MENISRYIDTLQESLELLPVEKIQEIVYILHAARQQGRQVFIMGNGGSAATATHFVCDLAKNTRKDGWPHFKVMGLSDNMAIFSAYANDEGYDHVFEGQLANWIQAGDIVIGISTSGRSPNVLKAIEFAKNVGATTIAFTGFDGGALKSIADVCVHVQSDTIEQVEDVHLVLEHIITKMIREEIQEASGRPLRINKHESQVSRIISGTQAEPSLELPRGGQGMSSRGANPSIEMLNRISQQLKGELDLHSLLRRTLELTISGVDAQSGSIVVLDDKGEVVEAELSYAGEVRSGGLANFAQVVKDGLAGWVARNRQPALIANTSEDPRWLAGPYDTTQRTRSAVSLPLLAGDKVVGVLTLVNPRDRQFTEVDLAYLTAITVCVSLSSQGVLVRPDAKIELEAQSQ